MQSQSVKTLNDWTVDEKAGTPKRFSTWPSDQAVLQWLGQLLEWLSFPQESAFLTRNLLS
jgi:hypothetical protein